ncbi:MAG: hypothetical protein KF878_24925 [Planctomycetes bacterium]|nr:hypothetical protein [Planctomycetota bacterium]
MSGEAPAPTPVDITWSTTVPVKATPRSGSGEGVKTAWELTPDPGNLDAKYVDPGRRARIGAATATGTAEGWSNFVQFAPASGERYRLSARTVGGASEVVKDVTVVTRQTVPVTVYHVDGAALAAWDAAIPLVRAAFDRVGITLDVKAKVKTDEGDRPLYKGLDPEGMDVDRTHRQPTPDDFRKGLGAFFKGNQLPPVKPAFGHLRVFVLGKLEQYYDLRIVGRVEREVVRSGELVVGAIPADWTSKLAPQPVLEATLDFGVMSYGVVDVKSKARRKNDTDIVFNLGRAFVEEHFGGSNSPMLSLRFEVVEAGFLGWSDGKNLVAVATKKAAGGALDAKTIARIVIHEVGHALGLVRPGRALHPRGAEENQRYYEGMGGVGPHCSTNAKPARGKMVFDRDRLCVMYHAGGPDARADTAFCPSCTIDLRLVDLGLLGPRKDWS